MIKILKINVQEPYFSFLKNGQKIVEGRLGKEKWFEYNKGDILLVNNELKLEITDIIKYKSFEEMLMTEGVKNTIPDKDTIPEAVDVYYKFYSKENEQKFGVVAIKFKMF